LTDPNASRYFITAEEVVSLVLHAVWIGEPGDILVLDSGEPIRILDLARRLIARSGYSEQEIEIIFTGLRPAEKLHESLFYSGERVVKTNHDRIKRIVSSFVPYGDLTQKLETLRSDLYSMTEPAIRSALSDLVCTSPARAPRASSLVAD
jgi:FlaA1/EpsC-like NDP-sugar epimerase